MVIYKGAAHYRGWYTELGEEEGDADAIFAYSSKGSTPGAVLTKPPGYKRSAPLPFTTPQSYKFLNTPQSPRPLPADP